MNEAISNIWRRPLRAALTILGIVIGVFALTVMGALAEKLNVLVDGGDPDLRLRPGRRLRLPGELPPDHPRPRRRDRDPRWRGSRHAGAADPPQPR
jgi:hypothetical protein